MGNAVYQLASAVVGILLGGAVRVPRQLRLALRALHVVMALTTAAFIALWGSETEQRCRAACVRQDECWQGGLAGAPALGATSALGTTSTRGPSAGCPTAGGPRWGFLQLAASRDDAQTHFARGSIGWAVGPQSKDANSARCTGRVCTLSLPCVGRDPRPENGAGGMRTSRVPTV